MPKAFFVAIGVLTLMAPTGTQMMEKRKQV
jgi:hypothetical protein